MRHLFFFAFATVAVAAEDYPLGPDSQPQQAVPRGEMRKFSHETSTVFPGTKHEWSLYIPKQYDAAKPACAMVFFDGSGFAKPDGQFRIPVVFDNLIAKKAMPVTVAVFISPGTVPATESGAAARNCRSYEFDSMGSSNARFVTEEIIPEVRKIVKLTDDPAGWGTCGSSSGGIAAFTLAWEKPDHFQKVISFIGSFTNIRGGYDYPALIRKTKGSRKPLRVFLQDGSADLDNLHGDWPLSNRDMAAALKYPDTISDSISALADTVESTAARSFRMSCDGCGATTRSSSRPHRILRTTEDLSATPFGMRRSENPHFPMQNCPKIAPSTSSVSARPTISPMDSIAARSSSATNSGDNPRSNAASAAIKSQRAFSKHA